MGLYNKIIDLQKLATAWGRVKANKPACGADNITWEQFDETARESLKELNLELKEHRYACRPVKMVTLYKGEKAREIALYCMRDKVVQQSAAMELTKIFEPRFSSRTYAYRPDKSALAAVQEIEKAIREGGFSFVLKTDITSFFDNILWDKLRDKLRREIGEEDVLELLRMSVMAKALQADGTLREKQVGIYQGSSLAPVMSNIYLMDFDRRMALEAGFFIRYSDDILVLGRDEAALRQVLIQIQTYFEGLGLSVSEKKTRLNPVKAGFDFLGYHFDDKGKAIPGKAEAQLSERLETAWLLRRNENIPDRLTKMAEILEGWEQYFRGKREIRGMLEYATVAHMIRNKPEIRTLAFQRVQFKNEYKELALYLSDIWKAHGYDGLRIYEAEEILGLGSRTGTEPAKEGRLPEGERGPSGEGGRRPGGALALPEKSGSLSEADERFLTEGNPLLLECLTNVLRKEDKDTLTELMQVYADLHQYNKASKIAERITEMETGARTAAVDISASYEGGQAGRPVTEAELEQFMELFCGREDMYATIDFINGRKNTATQCLPLTADVVRRHFQGETKVATFVQRTNATAKYFVIDIDVSRKVLIEAREKPELMEAALKKAGETALTMFSFFSERGMRPRIEFSGGRGYHVWLFFTEWIPVRFLNMLQDICEEKMKTRDAAITAEFFPNKARMKPGTAGQCIKLPMGMANARGRRSCLLEDDFTECASLKAWLDNTARYPLSKLKRLLATQTDAREVAAEKATVDPDLSIFGELPSNCRAVLEKCSLMRFLCRKAHDTGYLTHFERLSVLYVFGHMGEEGKVFIHKIMGFTLNYQHNVTDKFIRKCPEKPVSCIKLRDQYKSITAEFGCSCVFKQKKDCYPSPVLHAITQSQDETNEVTLPISRTLTKEKKQELSEEINIHKRAATIVSRIVDFKKQRRRLDQNVRKLEHELEEIFDSEKIECLELDIGLLVRVKKADGYEWKIEI